eukprot:jgi/Chrzof1/13384/Cz07g31020.t1
MPLKGKGAREWLLGDYDYKYLCTPAWPFCQTKPRRPPTFFGRDAFLGLLTSAVMGLQHALAMAGGLITPPLLVGLLSPDADVRAYLIQASLLVCGIMTAVQVTGIPLGRLKYKLGAGMLSVMGVSFASVPVATSTVTQLVDEGYTFDQAYGKLLGTILVCGVIPIIFSVLPYRVLRKVFPPIVTGVTIILIGAKLAGTGLQYWGGGVFCAENYEHLPTVFSNCSIPTAAGGSVIANCYNADIKPLCSGNGGVMLPFGSPQYVGLGFLVFSTIVLIELFGSPFMRNAAVVIALLFGYLIAAVSRYDGKSYVSTDGIKAAPVVTFLWVKTFPLGFHAPALIPLLVVFCITSIETVGDVTATEEASRLAVVGEAHTVRVRGALLNDGLSGIFSALGTSLPLTTFAQNNGVIALTAVASRWAGWAAAAWLFLLGVFAKFGAWVLSIPPCVLGGMTTFLFANVIASGIKIIVCEGSLHRRNRFILACSLGLGLGVTLVPQWAYNALWPVTPGMNDGLKGLREAIILVLETGFCLGAVVAVILNLLLPEEKHEPGEDLSTHEGPEIPDVSHHPRHHDGSTYNHDQDPSSGSSTFMTRAMVGSKDAEIMTTPPPHVLLGPPHHHV